MPFAEYNGSSAVAMIKNRVQGFFNPASANQSKNGLKVINALPADSGLAEVISCIRLYDITLYVCDVLNSANSQLPERVCFHAVVVAGCAGIERCG